MTTLIKKKKRSSSRYIDFDIVAEILLHLSPKQLARAKLVSKSWNSLIKSPNFSQSYNRTNKHNNPPYLLLLRLGRPITLNLYSIGPDRFNPMKSPVSIPDDCYYSVVSSSGGLVCISGGYWGKSLAVFNPTTSELFPLPNLPHRLLALWTRSIEDGDLEVEEDVGLVDYPDIHWDTRYLNVVSFGYHPPTNQYKVVQLLRDPAARIVRCYVLSVSTCFDRCCWREVEESLMCQARIGELTGCINGVIYWENFTFAGESVDIISFDLGTEKLKLLQSPWRCKSSHHLQPTRHLVELENKLCFVRTECNNSYNGEQLHMDIWRLVKDDNVGDLKSWTHMHRLELGPCPHNHPYTAYFPLFVDRHSNRIMLHDRGNFDDKLMYTYHLNDKSLKKYDEVEHYLCDDHPLIYILMSVGDNCVIHTEALVSLD